MRIARRSENGIIVVAPAGRVDAQGAAELEVALQANGQARQRRLVIDMSDVAYIGSKGLQALVTALAACRGSGGDLKLAGVTPAVMYILKIIKFDELFSVCDRVEDAITEFRRS